MTITAGQVVRAIDLSQPFAATAPATADLVQTTATAADIPGATVTFTTRVANMVATIHGVFDIMTTATGSDALGLCVVDGGTPQAQQAIWNLVTLNERATVTQSWTVALAAAGSHTIKLQGNLLAASGTATFSASHTGITVIVNAVGGASAPSGSAGGDLSGTYPNPTVAAVNGVAVSGTAASGKVLTATGSSAATWQTPSGSSLSWTTYVPTLALGGTLGNGVLYGAYCKSGTYCTVRVTFLWGSTTSITGAISINLPFTAATVTAPGVSTPIMWTGSAQAWIAAANNRAGVAIVTNGAAYFQATSDNIPSQWTPSTPVTIATNDHLCFEITYETV